MAAPRIRRAENPVDAYALDVVGGNIPAGRYHRRACERHLFDRRREGSREFPFRFVWESRRREEHSATRFLSFAGRLKHYKGEWAGRYFEPSACQAFRLGSIFGWRHVETGARRFTTAYNELPRKTGKALWTETPVPTPSGWTKHGDLRVGDRVFGPDGQPKRVQWIGPIINDGPCYRVTVSTGEAFVSHAAHEWVTSRSWFTGRPRGSRRPLPPVETERIAETLRCGSRGDYVHRIKVAEPLELPAADLPIPPYTMGAWLGDGTSSSAAITSADPAIIQRIESEGVRCEIVQSTVHDTAPLYRLNGRQGSSQSLTSRLRTIGVIRNKHIPTAYLRASYAQRLEVLRGLIDTDGYCGPKGIYEIALTNRRLAIDARELIHTLGLKSHWVEDRARIDGRDCGPRYRLTFSAHLDAVATLPRKVSPWQPSIQRRSRARTIVGCDRCESVPVNCIQVEGGLYLIGRDFVATHNSFEAAIVAIYGTFFEGEAGAEGYCVATKREQARRVFDDARRMVLSSGLKSRIKVNAANLYRDDLACKLEPLGADADSTDGLNPHIIITDEFHAHKTRALIDVMESATGARRNPLHFQITTAGNDPVSPCGDQHDYVTRILDGVLDDDPATLSMFAFIAHADAEDDWREEATWRKANPHYGVSVKPEDMQKLAAKAIHMPSAAAEFQQKRLNLWVNASAPWLSLEGWRKGQSSWSPEEMEGEPCYVGLDLASKIDLCALVCLFPPTSTRDSWRLLPFAWTPEETLHERAHRDRAPYDVWASQGYMLTVPGEKISQAAVRRAILDLKARYRVQAIGYDDWHMDQLDEQLVEEDGLARESLVVVPQTYAGMSSACLRFEAEVLGGHIDAGGSPLMAWCASNVVVQRDGKDNIYPVKKRSRGRIDPIVAANIAMAVYLKQPAAPVRKKSVYATRQAEAVMVGGGSRDEARHSESLGAHDADSSGHARARSWPIVRPQAAGWEGGLAWAA